MIGTRTRGIVGAYRAMRVETGPIASHAIRLHRLRGLAAQICTEGITAAALLAAYLDEGERLTLQIQGEAPRFALTVDVYESGDIRARMTPGWVTPQEGPLQGILLVLKSVVGREVYRGVTPLAHTSLERMLQQHLLDSAQAPARVAIDGSVGAFVERLPDEVIDDDALQQAAKDVLVGLDGEQRALNWACACSREKVVGMIRGLGTHEIRAMIEEDRGAKITCHFCTNTVSLDVVELEALLS